MDQNYIIMTDSDSDLPYTIADEKHIPVVRMPYTLDDVEHLDDNGRSGVEAHFFQRMREGAMPTTSQLPVGAYLDFFEPVLKERDILFIAFSSAMSATIGNVRQAREELLERYPNRRLTVVDTLTISAPMTLLILQAQELYEQGKSMDEIEQWLLDNRLHSQMWITVADLKYLARGGRLSPTSAAFGSLLGVRPIICIGKNGMMECVEKARGSKRTLQTLIERTAENIEHPESQTITVLHGDVREDAEQFASMLRERIPTLQGIRIQTVGPVIGCHSGPGMLGVAFMGKERVF